MRFAAVLVTVACGGAPVAPSSLVVLSRVETYRAPRSPGPEPYDERRGRGDQVPSRSGALVCDLVLRIEVDLQRSRDDLDITLLQQAIDTFDARTPRTLRGLRPWTHWHFVQSLAPGERDQLAIDAAHAWKTRRPRCDS